MKRLAFALTAIGFSSAIFAAMPAASNPTEISVPQLSGGIVIGVTGYYLRPSPNNGDLDFASLNTGTTSPFNSRVQSIQPGYDWGWGVNIGYVFPHTGNDVNLSYFQFNTDEPATVTNTSTTASISPIPFDIGGLTVNRAHGKVKYDLDQVDLTAGQYVDIGCRLQLHPFAGVRYTDLERKLNDDYIQITTSSTSTSAFITEKSDFTGVGPLAGIDGSYYIGRGIGLVGHFDGGLLVGNMDSNFEGAFVLRNAQAIAVSSNANFKADSVRRIVPVIDGKLGADYTYIFSQYTQGSLTLEGGYQVSHYFNAVDLLPATNTSIIGRSTSDLGVDGFYVSLTFRA